MFGACRFARAESADELLVHNRTGYRISLLEAYNPDLYRRWNEGCANATRLFEEIRTHGYRGSEKMVRNYLQPFRALAHIPAPPPKPPTVRKVASWIMTDPDALAPGHRARLDAILAASPQLAALTGHVRDFAEIMAQRRGRDLEQWMTAVDNDDQPALHSFVRGLRRDQDAVTAGLTMSWSSGTVEGHVNRIKNAQTARHVVASERVSAMQRLLVGHVGLKHGLVWVADDGDAVAVWTDPDTERAAAIGARQGFGNAIVLPGMKAAEQAGVPNFLKISDERNLRFYRRLGFEVTAEVAATHGHLTLHRVRVCGHETPNFGRSPGSGMSRRNMEALVIVEAAVVMNATGVTDAQPVAYARLLIDAKAVIPSRRRLGSRRHRARRPDRGGNQRYNQGAAYRRGSRGNRSPHWVPSVAGSHTVLSAQAAWQHPPIPGATRRSSTAALPIDRSDPPSSTASWARTCAYSDESHSSEAG
ncbi:transposase [Nocardia sp. CDC186]|uniref:Transposase n=1 Tax=Nocardia implantans TaxID=3108168 RepID=A0ABU6B2N6_9NOCA|nr:MULTISPECIES: transposase [unclassified Nocardia]MBF6195906.1 transposase [Nocardia beijingensis]MEA3531786.1 transposase [Nocardia sp. CDC192]MEB3513951.1 transposase [Nocardia sp. CDC186]